MIAGNTLRLEDGLGVDVATLRHLPPCSSKKIISPHMTYTPRGMESRKTPQPTETPTYFLKPATAAKRPWR